MSSTNLSLAEMELLAFYRTPRYLDHQDWQRVWEQSLPRTYLETIQRFTEMGLLSDEVSDFDRMHYGPQSSVPSLKAVLKSEGLSSSGNKDDLIRRLLSLRPAKAKEVLATCMVLYVCSTAGLAAVEPLLHRITDDDKRMAAVHREASGLLRYGEVDRASSLIGEFLHTAYSFGVPGSVVSVGSDGSIGKDEKVPRHVHDEIVQSVSREDKRMRQKAVKEVTAMVGTQRPVPDPVIETAVSLLGLNSRNIPARYR